VEVDSSGAASADYVYVFESREWGGRGSGKDTGNTASTANTADNTRETRKTTTYERKKPGKIDERNDADAEFQ
jgi:hypothetical protein